MKIISNLFYNSYFSLKFEQAVIVLQPTVYIDYFAYKTIRKYINQQQQVNKEKFLLS